MLGSAVLFASNVLLIRALGDREAVSVWLVTGMRFAVGVAVLLAVYPRQTRFGRVFRQPRLALRGVVGGIGVYAYYLAVVHIGAGRATFINNTYVMFGALFAVWILHEPFRGVVAVGGVAALGGLALLTNAFTHGASVYDLVAVVSALGSAVIVVVIRMLHADGEHTATIFAAQCVYGLLLCGGPALLHLGHTSGPAWALMILAGTCAAAGQLAMTRAFRDLPVAEGSLLQILVPLGTAAGGVICFGERFAPHELLGAALILAGTGLSGMRKRA